MFLLEFKDDNLKNQGSEILHVEDFVMKCLECRTMSVDMKVVKNTNGSSSLTIGCNRCDNTKLIVKDLNKYV